MLRHFLCSISSPAPIRKTPTRAKWEWEADWERGCSADAAGSRPASWQWLVLALQLSPNGHPLFLHPLEASAFSFSALAPKYLVVMESCGSQMEISSEIVLLVVLLKRLLMYNVAKFGWPDHTFIARTRPTGCPCRDQLLQLFNFSAVLPRCDIASCRWNSTVKCNSWD